MEGGTSLGTYVAYALIVLFLIVLVLVIARAMMLASLLLLEPLGLGWKWLGNALGGRRRAATREEPAPPHEAGDAAERSPP